MATSGSKTVAIFSSWLHLKFSWWQNSQSIENNTTTIGWKMELITGNGTLWFNGKAWSVVIDGEKYSGTTSIDLNKNSTGTLASGTATINHNDDGSKTFAYSFSQTFNSTLNNGSYMGTYSGSGSDTLTTIARASQPSLVTYPETTNDVGDFGVEFGIHMNRKSSAFTHTVRYEYGSRSGVIARNVETGVRWAVPLEFMNDIPNATSGSGRIYVDTYNGSTFVGTKYTGFTATVPASVKPSCTIQVLDNTDIQATYGSLVKGLSKLYVKTNFYAAYGSPVTAYNVTANGMKYTEAEIVTGVLARAGTTTITATVNDKRGRTSTAATASFPVLDYSPPKIPTLSVHRCNQDGTVNDRGEYVELLFSGEVTPLNNKNTATYSVRYKKTSVDSWTTLTTDVNGWKPSDLKNNFAVYNQSYIFAADGSSSYDVEVSVTDNHGTASRATSASTAFTLINYHPDGNAMRFGGVAEVNNAIQNDLMLIQTGNQFCFGTNAADVMGYVAMVQIEIIGEYANAPITFEFSRRESVTTMKVHVRFSNNDSLTPSLDTILYEGDNYGAFIVNTEGSTWTLYVAKFAGEDSITLQQWTAPTFMNERIKLTYPGTVVESVPKPYYRATPAVVRSIIDCLLPVGMIIQLYSHADPNEMYPGTTWVRMVNTFLWGCDENGGIGTTGGEKTVTLTASQIPAHNHGGTYTNAGTATKTHAWLASGGSAMAYDTVNAGGGAAHNNMPPYTQVSIWRRTA